MLEFNILCFIFADSRISSYLISCNDGRHLDDHHAFFSGLVFLSSFYSNILFPKFVRTYLSTVCKCRIYI